MIAEKPAKEEESQPPSERLLVKANGIRARMTQTEVRYGQLGFAQPRCNIAKVSCELPLLERGRQRRLRCHSRPAARTSLRRSCAPAGSPVHLLKRALRCAGGSL